MHLSTPTDHMLASPKSAQAQGAGWLALTAAALTMTALSAPAQAGDKEIAAALAVVASAEPAPQWLATRTAGELAAALAVVAAAEPANLLLAARARATLGVTVAMAQSPAANRSRP